MQSRSSGVAQADKDTLRPPRAPKGEEHQTPASAYARHDGGHAPYRNTFSHSIESPDYVTDETEIEHRKFNGKGSDTCYLGGLLPAPL